MLQLLLVSALLAYPRCFSPVLISVTDLETMKICRCSHSLTLEQCGCLLTLLLKSRFSGCLLNHLVVDAQNARRLQISSVEGQTTEGVLLFVIQAVKCFWSLCSLPFLKARLFGEANGPTYVGDKTCKNCKSSA